MLNKLYRATFTTIWFICCRYTPVYFNFWRIIILKVFGAKLHISSKVYSSVNIRNPNLLAMEKNSCLGPDAIVYNVSMVALAEGAVVSQRAHLCTASHNLLGNLFELQSKPIKIGRYCWVAAETFVGPGVELGDYAVAYARAVVVRDIGPSEVWAGNPAKFLKYRDQEERRR